MQLRIPVLSIDNKPLMPAKPSRVRKWIEQGKAVKKWSDCGIFYVQFTQPTGDTVQPVVIGIDPGKLYSGIAVQSAKVTLYTAHLVLPFKTVKQRMEQRAMMRRGRRGRRIDRKVAFSARAHRQKRFDNRTARKVPPSIKANRQLEHRIASELCKIFPISKIVFEYVKAVGSKGFSPVMVGQRWAIEKLSELAPVQTLFGWETAQIRTQLGLIKDRDKAAQTPQTHAVDGIALASSVFIQYQKFDSGKDRGHHWQGSVEITPSVFFVVKRPPISRRQLHLMVPAKGGLRRKYGGSITRFGLRKGDLVQSPKGLGFVSGDSEKRISVSDVNWKRLGLITAKKVQLVRRSNGLLVCEK